MNSKPVLVSLDLEGVLVPEIWINVAERTRIAELRITTREEPDYDKLMRRRIGILRERRLKLRDVTDVIGAMRPLPGARDFLDRLRASYQVVILSDTFYEFAAPLMRQLGYPTLFCNRLGVDRAGFIRSYHLRQKDGKRKAVRAFRSIGFEVRAAGDSYNDVTMLKAADRGVFFNPPAAIARQFPALPVARSYERLFAALSR
jgi:phosphoserine / homoserine phosphotransferase